MFTPALSGHLISTRFALIGTLNNRLMGRMEIFNQFNPYYESQNHFCRECSSCHQIGFQLSVEFLGDFLSYLAVKIFPNSQLSVFNYIN